MLASVVLDQAPRQRVRSEQKSAVSCPPEHSNSVNCSPQVDTAIKARFSLDDSVLRSRTGFRRAACGQSVQPVSTAFSAH